MEWHTKAASAVALATDTDVKTGLGGDQVRQKQLVYGKNRLDEKKGKSVFQKFFDQFKDFMIIILLIAAIVSFGVSVAEGHPDYADSIIILLIVIANAVMGVVQEGKAEKSLSALKKMAAPMAKVRRDGVVSTIDAAELVPGDIILIEAGDFVPADARLVESVNLKIEESALTGESVPVDKDAGVVLAADATTGDRINMIMSSSIVTYGRGSAIVVETGMKTQIGKIAQMIMQENESETPLQQKLSQTGKMLGIGALIICAVIFVIGWARSIPPLEMFMTSVGLAVAAIPEGLPAIVTIVLAMGVQTMARKNAIVRRLPAVETLGGASVICSDKTGTLTQNKMTVVELADFDGKIALDSSKGGFILELSTLCNDSILHTDSGKFVIHGDPTETALVMACANAGKVKNDIEVTMPRVAEIPFDSSRKLMTTIHKLVNGKFRVVTKGAPDVLLARCTDVFYDDKKTAISEIHKTMIAKHNVGMADSALRVLAVAFYDIDMVPTKLTPEAMEKDMTFVGLIGMIDPPREEVKQAVQVCRRAGIKAVMITGDHVSTAIAIARELGILREGDLSMTGAELAKMTQQELNAVIDKYSVFARVSPEHKVMIVQAWKSRDDIVAMTGDGVNDAPALKASDIGCAMGITGTDVAKGAADIVLTDDNFATIVEAVREGRGIFENIKKSIQFLLSSNIGEILTIFVAMLVGWPMPLLAIHLLWVNLVTDSFPAISLGVDPISGDIMSRPPRNPKKGLFADGLIFTILMQGVMIGVLTILAFNFGLTLFDANGDHIVGRTMAFAVLSISQLVHAFNMRSDKSIFKIGVFGNKMLVYSFVFCLIMEVAVICIPPIASIFKVTPLDLEQWAIVAGLSIMPLVIIEAQKFVDSKRASQG